MTKNQAFFPLWSALSAFFFCGRNARLLKKLKELQMTMTRVKKLIGTKFLFWTRFMSILKVYLLFVVLKDPTLPMYFCSFCRGTNKFEIYCCVKIIIPDLRNQWLRYLTSIWLYFLSTVMCKLLTTKYINTWISSLASMNSFWGQIYVLNW